MVIPEASEGDTNAVARRLESLRDIADLPVDKEMGEFAKALMLGGVMPASSETDALHNAIAAVHRMDYLLTWNCRHINNASTKPIIRRLCEEAGYVFPEICTPLELLSEETKYV